MSTAIDQLLSIHKQICIESIEDIVDSNTIARAVSLLKNENIFPENVDEESLVKLYEKKGKDKFCALVASYLLCKDVGREKNLYNQLVSFLSQNSRESVSNVGRTLLKGENRSLRRFDKIKTDEEKCEFLRTFIENSVPVVSSKRLIKHDTPSSVSKKVMSAQSDTEFPRRYKNFENEWKMLQQLGSGGYGTVSLYENKKTGRVVAVKKSEINGYDFLQEAASKEFNLIRDIQDKCNVAKVEDFFYIDDPEDELYMMMEYVPGKTLWYYISQINAQKKLPFDVYDLVGIYEDLLLQLNCIHKKNLIHNDIKSANIIVYPEEFLDDDGSKYTLWRARLIDFGLSCYDYESEDMLYACEKYNTGGSIVAPETIYHKTISTKSDIFALGIVFAEILYGFHYNVLIHHVLDEKDYDFFNVGRDRQMPIYKKYSREIPEYFRTLTTGYGSKIYGNKINIPIILSDIIRVMTVESPLLRPSAQELIDNWRK